MIRPKERLDLIKMFPAGALIAEIGVWRGGFSNEILTHCPVGRLYLIDPYKEYYAGVQEVSQQKHEEHYLEAQRVISHHSNRAVIIRDTSEHAARTNFVIPPLDGVYIDADHTYDAAMMDLVLWSKRLKPGGVLMGHDYTDDPKAKDYALEVIPAVNDFCKKYGWVITHLTNEIWASFRLEKL